MRKVGTITMFHNSINYGGVLQTYALHKVLSKIGYDSIIIRYSTSWNIICDLKKEILEITNASNPFKSIYLFIIKIGNLIIDFVSTKFVLTISISKKLDERRKAFETFNANHIKATSTVYTEKTISQCADIFDIFITGSDQVWNPYLFTPGYGLGFVPDTKLKISYAASIAQPFLTQSDIRVMQPYLKRFDAVSVREDRAKELLKDTMNINAEWVLDPTLLLTEAEWSSLICNKVHNEPYIFCYILGAEKDKIIFSKRIAEHYNLPMVTLPFVSRYFRIHHLKNMQFGDEQLYNVGPTEFLELIKSAEYVITDSFHGAVFSLMFHKKFTVLERNSQNAEFEMNSRLQSLVKLFNLDEVLISDYNEEKVENCFIDINYNVVEDILSSERKKSMLFLDKSMNAHIKK